nr:MerR family transcriptional regulator [Chloroflexota bacterium]
MEDRFAGRADGFDEHYTEPRGRVRLDLVLERLDGVLPPPPVRILDAGGGTGAFAIPLARIGYNVTLADQSADWLDRARSKADAAGVDLDLVNIGLESLTDAGLEPFDAILCHAVLMYIDDPAVVLRTLRSVAAPGAVLSLLEKNRDGIALRPGLQGDYAEARRLLTERDSVGRLGVGNRAYAVSEWLAMLAAAGWSPDEWVGIRLFSDHAPDGLGTDAYTYVNKATLDLRGSFKVRLFNMTTLTISQLARRSGVPATTLRYYEKVGVIPAATRSDAGYRLYDDAAVARLAFVQRAKALGIELDDLADLVRLWDGEGCAPVQERLRAMVHDQRTATHQRMEELTKLAADLDAVGASIGDAACGPDCACLQPVAESASEPPVVSERLIGAACTLDATQLRERLREWRELRDRATSVEPI